MNRDSGVNLKFSRSFPITSGVSELSKDAIDASTLCCAVYGHPVRHSASPTMQNAGIAALGMNWRYLAFDVLPDQLREAIVGAASMRFVGLNLTLPHKLLALKLVDIIDPSGLKYGAVNTIRFEARVADGSWQPIGQSPTSVSEVVRSVGYNTDADAIIRSLREDLNCEPRGASVLLLGAGGAGSVAAFRLAEEGVGELHLANRTLAKADALAVEIRRRFPATRTVVGYPSDPVDLVLNATSLGLERNDPLPLDERQFPLQRAGAVYDMVYRPAETRLLEAARRARRPHANGLGMLLYQGAKALEIWTGRSAPVEVMREALAKAVYGE
jgi:shikimate dehydrogenase